MKGHDDFRVLFYSHFFVLLPPLKKTEYAHL